MRTKTLVLTALGALCAIGAMAQTNVYSLNAVGYINVTCPPGFSIISDQLWNSSTGPNYLGQVLRSSDPNHDFDSLFKWIGTGFAIYTPQSSGTPNGWALNGDGTDPGTNVTLNPGEAAFYQNADTSPITFTFVGTVPQGTNTVNLALGFNLVSSVVPQAGRLTQDLGFPVDGGGAQDFDSAYIWNNASGYSIFTPNGESTTADKWTPTDPTIPVGTGFFYQATQTPVTWTRVFSVNQ